MDWKRSLSQSLEKGLLLNLLIQPISQVLNINNSSLPPISSENGGWMKGQHPVTATKAPSTTLAISLELKVVSLL